MDTGSLDQSPGIVSGVCVQVTSGRACLTWTATNVLLRRFGLDPLVQGKHAPDLVVFLNPGENSVGVKECTLRSIPTVAIVDTHLDPRIVTYPIPANGDVRAIPLALGLQMLMGGTEPAHGRVNMWDTVHGRSRRAALTIEGTRGERKARSTGAVGWTTIRNIITHH